MRRGDRRLGQAQNLLERGRGELGDVDQDAQFIHAGDALLAHFGEPAIFIRVISQTRIGPR